MAFPKSTVISGFTSEPGVSDEVASCFLSLEVMNEALLILRSMSPTEVSQLAAMETSQIALSLHKFKDDNNRRFSSRDEVDFRSPRGQIKHIDNRVTASIPGTSHQYGVRIQYIDNWAKTAATFISGVTTMGVLTGATSGVSRGLAQIAVVLGAAGTGYGAHYLTKKTASVNQMAAHIKKLAEAFNSTYEAFEDFRRDVVDKRSDFRPDLNSDNPRSFEQETTFKNNIPPNEARGVEYLLRQLAYTREIERIDIVGRGDNFVALRLDGRQFDLSRTQYGYLSTLKLA